MSEVIAATGARERAPTSNIDPFSLEFFADPFPAHQELREAGPAVWLCRYGVWAVARYEDVHRVLTDWRTFCSSRGIGMSDFSRRSPGGHRVSSWRRTHPSMTAPAPCSIVRCRRAS